MIYDLWYRVSRTVFPFISIRRYHEICDDYDALIDKQFDRIESQANIIEDLRSQIGRLNDELNAMWYPEISGATSIDLPDSVESFEPIPGKSITASGTITFSETNVHEFILCNTTDEEDVSRMDNDGCVDPNQWGRD